MNTCWQFGIYICVNDCFNFTCRFFIRRFGAAVNFDSATYERFHRDVVVEPFSKDCRREEGQIERLRIAADHMQLVNTYLDKDVQDPQARPICHTVSGPRRKNLVQFLLDLPRNNARAVSTQIRITLGNDALLASYKLYNIATMDYGEERVRFVSSNNYLRRGARCRFRLSVIGQILTCIYGGGVYLLY